MFYILLLVASFIAGAWLKPSLDKSNGVWYFHYSLSKGNRNKVKLF